MLVRQFIERDQISPEKICVFGQNDGFGLLGVRYLKLELEAFQSAPAVAYNLEALTAVLDSPPEMRNYLGPVGLYERALSNIRDGVESLQQWGAESKASCEGILLFATQEPAIDFLVYTEQQRLMWKVGVLSVVDRAIVTNYLRRESPQHITVYYNQLVPPIDSPLPLMQEAIAALGSENAQNTIVLEGYIAGRLAAHGVLKAGAPVTPESLKIALSSHPLDLSGLTLDFTQGNQGANDIWLLRYDQDDFHLVH